jgi:rSAM/selenodomain-associated transferase 2/rSAM/selenodomain-associated transferase 1
VVPTLNESARLPLLLHDLALLGDVVDEVIVVDGGSEDDTARVAREAGATVLEVPRGRGRQLLAGGRAARGAWLLFLHADSRLSHAAAAAVRSFLDDARETDFAHFGFALEGSPAFARFIWVGQRIRERLTGLVYGDQGLLVSRALYEKVGGHPPWTVMEDVAVMDRLRAEGRRIRLPAALPTSDRRYVREGRLRAWLRNVVLITRFRFGARAEDLAHRYAPEPSAAGATSPAVVALFARAPMAGLVKTRLAADVGNEEALRIYRTIGGETVNALRDGPWQTELWVTPPSAEAHDLIRDWVGEGGLTFHSQGSGDLGDRMSAAVRQILARAGKVVIVGTDIPGIDAGVVHEALDALDGSDVVLGPSMDGGYYLIGMRSPHPALFRDIEWSTSRVLEQTRAEAAKASLRVALLAPRTDVDTLEDVPPAYLNG